ncbi:MAG: 4-hydroxyphenylpyruvate dioxygenase, partial [Waterburya sp.]
ISQHTHTELIALNSAFFVISSPLNTASPVAQYLNFRPSGIVDIAFRVKNLAEIINRGCSLGVKLLQDSQLWRTPQGSFKFAQITGWHDLQHTLIEANGHHDYCLPMPIKQHEITNSFQSYITNIDHLVLNVAQGQLDSAVKLYQALFKFQVQQSFTIQTNKSGLASQALIDDAGEVQFNINEPTSTNSQIQEFIDLNNGSGIQHLALRSPNLIADVAQMQQQGLEFLNVPQVYYRNLKQLLSLSTAEQQAISQQQILVDSDHSSPQSLLMQIFTQPIFEQPTFFLEFIERRREAQGFGQGNFKALFEAVEREQGKRAIALH